eukprot:40632-Hanusia_phi.AAC.1
MLPQPSIATYLHRHRCYRHLHHQTLHDSFNFLPLPPPPPFPASSSPDPHSSQHYDLQDIFSGGRALPAVIRPYPMRTAGDPMEIKFDVRDRIFYFRFCHDPG